MFPLAGIGICPVWSKTILASVDKSICNCSKSQHELIKSIAELAAQKAVQIFADSSACR